MELIEEARKLVNIYHRNNSVFPEPLEKQWKQWLSTELAAGITRVAGGGNNNLEIPAGLSHFNKDNLGLSTVLSSYINKMLKTENGEEKLINDIKEVIGDGFEIKVGFTLYISWREEQ